WSVFRQYTTTDGCLCETNTDVEASSHHCHFLRKRGEVHLSGAFPQQPANEVAEPYLVLRLVNVAGLDDQRYGCLRRVAVMNESSLETVLVSLLLLLGELEVFRLSTRRWCLLLRKYRGSG